MRAVFAYLGPVLAFLAGVGYVAWVVLSSTPCSRPCVEPNYDLGFVLIAAGVISGLVVWLERDRRTRQRA